MTETTATERELQRLLGGVLPPDAGEFNVEPGESLRQAGLPSVTYIAFIAAIERRYQFDWDEDIPAETMRSIASLAHYVDQLKDR